MAVLSIGYIGIYLCRKNLGVAIPLLQEAFSASKESVGWIASFGTVAYAIGKIINGPVVDRIGGRRGFVLAVFGVAIFGATAALAPSLAVLAACYGANRFAGAAGWGAMMKLVPTWFPSTRTATVIALLSLTYVGGGAAATMLARAIVVAGGGWRVVMAGPAIVVLAVGVLAAVMLRSGPIPESDRLGAKVSGHGFSLAALVELLRLRRFLLACGLSFSVTLLREALNTWSVDFLTSIQGGTKSLALAAVQSIGFDLAGIVGILSMGIAYGRLPPKRRRWVIAIAMLVLAGVLALLASTRGLSPTAAAVLLALCGYLVYGPFSLLSGVIALETGGSRLVATAAGVIDGTGYVAAALAGATLGRLLDIGGYALGFSALAAVSLGASVLALGFPPAEEQTSKTTASTATDEASEK